MLARDLARPCYIVALHCDAIAAARLLCAGSVPFLVLVDSSGEPHSFIQAQELLRHLLSGSLRAEPGLISLTGPFAEAHVVRALGGQVGDWLSEHATAPVVVTPNTPLTQVMVHLLRTDSPGVVVADRTRDSLRIHGVITAQQLLGRLLKQTLHDAQDEEPNDGRPPH
jgi:hypothetical protein